MSERLILLNPGPVTLSSRVRSALNAPDMCHREPDFQEILRDIRSELLAVYEGAGGDFQAVLLTGSGTCAVEAMLSSLAPREGHRTLVVSNGVYGERMAAMLAAQSKPFEIISSGWSRPWDFPAIERRLTQDPSIRFVAAVHHETTTGRLNDVEQLDRFCDRFGAVLLLDAVSSFGGEEIAFDRWRLAAVAGSANKCLHAVPGVSFVLIRRDLLGGPTRSPSVYLDLFRYVDREGAALDPFTSAVPACCALREALRELRDQGGWRARNAHYRNLSTAIRAALARLGLRAQLTPDEFSASLSAFQLPDFLTYQQLHDAMRAAGFVIYASQAGFRDTHFRIANMGNVTQDDVIRLVAALEQFVASRKKLWT